MSLESTSIPDGWRIARLGQVAEVVGGSTPSRTRPECWGGDIPWVVPSELTELAGRHLQSSRESITVDGLKSAGLRVLPARSVLLTTRATIGLTALNELPVTTNQGFQSLVGKSGIDSLWLYYCISSKRRELERRGAGSTFREVSRDGVRTLPILLPPLSEQRAIAGVLDSIDEAIERTDKVIAATERLRGALLHELLTRGLPGQHSEWKEVPGHGTIPASWKVVRLGDVAEVRSGQVDPRDPGLQHLQFIAPDDLESATGRLILRRRVSDAGAISGKYEFDEHDVVYSKIRPYLMKVYLPKNSGLCSADMYPIRPRRMLTRSYLALVLVSPSFTDYARKCSDRTGIPKINRTDLLQFQLRLPSLSEQRAIGAVLGGVDAAIDRTLEERDDLQSLQASTADALLTGRVRVDQQGQKGMDQLGTDEV